MVEWNIKVENMLEKEKLKLKKMKMKMLTFLSKRTCSKKFNPF